MIQPADREEGTPIASEPLIYSSTVASLWTGLRGIAKALVPTGVRQWLRRMQSDLPNRLRDLPGDLADGVGLSSRPLPPSELRARVGRTGSRSEYSVAGRLASRSVLELCARHGNRATGRWLDFGCGSGRIARFLIEEAPNSRLVGTDVDSGALLWNARHLRGSFVLLGENPPLPFREGSFDVIVASSVFTHFDHPTALSWLSEIRRVLRPGALLVASTHSEMLTYARPDLTVEDHQRLGREGFVFRRGSGRFNDDCSFHTRAFLEREWGRLFELVEHVPFGLAGFQDLSAWRRPA